MSLYHSTDADGISEINPSPQRMRDLVALLDEPEFLDKEHPDLSLIHDASGWSLTLFPSGNVVWENLDDEAGAATLTGVSRNRAYELWLMLSRGEIEQLKRQGWRAGAL